MDDRRLMRLRPNLERRALVHEATRDFFREEGFLEIDTPVRLREIAPELYIVPFLSEDWYLSTSPELHMKRLLAAGYERIFQVARCFRKGERGRHHNPEFTMLEWYRAGGDYRQMIKDTEQLVASIARRLELPANIFYQGHEIDLTPPWEEITVHDAFIKTVGWDPVIKPDPIRFDTDLVTKVIPTFAPDRPTVLLDYPAPMASLARLKPSDPQVAERAEVFIGGLEIANAYSELNDAKEQARRFREEAALTEKEQGRKVKVPDRFLEAVARLPACGGIALGIDRLVMLFCNTDNIEDVMPFTADTA